MLSLRLAIALFLVGGVAAPTGALGAAPPPQGFQSDAAFEGSGAFLLGAILDRFFSEYAALNHFTETVICTTERGEIMRWPVRMGTRRAL